MHKVMIALATAGLFSLGAAAAFAQQTPQTADMAVTGTIVPAACKANFDGGGVVDYGTIKLVDLPANAYQPLGTKEIALTVNCSAMKTVTFAITDMQSTSKIADTEMYRATGTSARAAPQYVFGLGKAAVGDGEVNVGSYAIAYSTSPAATIDRTPYNIIVQLGPGSWKLLDSHYVHGGTFAVGGAVAGPVRGSIFYIPMRITAALNKGSALQVAQDTPFNGQAVFAINYQ